MIGQFFPSSDIGNRITELSKAVSRMHSDMKVIQQLIIDDGHTPAEAPSKEGSSILGKYIIGAKNNFIGFNSRQDEKTASLKVTVHHGEEGVEKEKEKSETDTKQESDVQQNHVSESGAEESKPVADCDVVKMEEGRAEEEQSNVKEIEKNKQVASDTDENSENGVQEEVVVRTSLNNVEEKVNEATQDLTGKTKEEEILTEVKAGEKNNKMTPKQPKSIKVDIENTETQKVITKFKEMELQERKVETKRIGRKFEYNVPEMSGIRENKDKSGAQKTIPSPTGSSSSQDTGFGSQEGEGSIDGILVSP